MFKNDTQQKFLLFKKIKIRVLDAIVARTKDLKSIQATKPIPPQ